MESTADLISDLRQRGYERTRVEVKTAVGGLPKSAKDTLSAFRNGTGGVLILGLDESQGFTASPGFDASAIRDALAEACANGVTPPVRGEIEIEPVEGGYVVRLDVDEADPIDKPCSVTAKGTYGGSFVRGGDGDRRLTEYEVTQLIANKSQPVWDREPVSEAQREDLDVAEVRRLLDRVRANQPRVFGDIPDDEALVVLGALTDLDGRLVPTLAGVLCLGRHPQRFFPQLNASLVLVAGSHMGEGDPGAPRFLENRTFDGTVPEIVSELMAAVRRNTARGAVVAGVGRRDVDDYPDEVVREAIVNAVMHRDYSPHARGTQVQVEIYSDRLVVRNPGGIFGGVDPASFGEQSVSSSRNGTLARLLSDVRLPGRDEVVCENRGSGIPRTFGLLRAAGMSPPVYRPSIAQFAVEFPRHALLNDATLRWLAGLDPDLTEDERLALAILRETGELSNGNLRGWGMTAAQATKALTSLARRGLVRRDGGRRYATYELASHARSGQPTLDFEPVDLPSLRSDQARVLLAFRSADETSTRDVMEILGWQYQRVLRRINDLIDLGLIEATAATTSRRRSYRLTELGEQALLRGSLPREESESDERDGE